MRLVVIFPIGNKIFPYYPEHADTRIIPYPSQKNSTAPFGRYCTSVSTFDYGRGGIGRLSAGQLKILIQRLVVL